MKSCWGFRKVLKLIEAFKQHVLFINGMTNEQTHVFI